MSSMQTSTPAASTVSKEKPWHAAFPAPLSSLENGTLSSITVSQLQEKVKAQRDLSKRDFLVVDVRRTDFEDAFIRGAVNLPAQSFYVTLDSLLPLLTSYKQVIFHCQSSAGRGPRCAAWYQDRLNETNVAKDVSEGVVLEGGVKKWVKEVGIDDEDTVKL